jgi:glycosyltransferase involved in cell wall biosynthesis
MKNKLLTLAVPTYNMEKYLARCLDSVLCDNKDYLEVLVVNDGSKDRSSEIGHEYEAKYPDVIRVIDKENGNYGTCVNRALAEAKGKYFRMLDADDWCNTDALNQWLEELKTCDADMVLTISEDRGADNELLLRMDAPSTMQSGRIMSADEFDAHALGYKYIYCSHVVTYRTELLRQIGLELQAGISYTDNEYVFFPLDHIHSAIYYELPVYQYFVGREGQTTELATMAKSVKQIQQVYSRLWAYYFAHKQNQISSVLNNQQLVLAEMVHWMYRICFAGDGNKEKENILRTIESEIKSEPIIYNRHEGIFIRYGVDVLAYFRETGRYISNPIAKATLFYNRVFQYIKRKIKR